MRTLCIVLFLSVTSPSAFAASAAVSADALSLSDILTLIALVLGPAIGVFITIFYQRWQDKRRSKLWILSSIISNRHQIFSSNNVKAMNTIDLVFANNKDVRDAWENFVNVVRDANASEEKRKKVYNAMVDTMCASLGYGDSMRYLDLERVIDDPSVLRAMNLEEGFLELIRMAKTYVVNEVTKTTLPSGK